MDPSEPQPSETNTTRIREQRLALPDQPGVYIFRDVKGRVIYVGKAKSVRKRVASHFSNRGSLSDFIDHIEYIVVHTEAEALLTEQNFIKQYKPRFNVRLRDDKSYPFIAISLDEDFPRVYFTRERHRRDRVYFGPYSSAKRVRGTLNLLSKIFLFRSCEGPEPGRRSGSPCLDYFIKRCSAPCVSYVTKDEYRESIDGVIAFLSGHFHEIERDLERKMEHASAKQDYEQATIERNRLQAVRSLLERQRVARGTAGSYDAVAVAIDGKDANAQVFQVRDGVLSDRQSFYLDNEAEHELDRVVEEFLLQYYTSALSIPALIVVQPGAIGDLVGGKDSDGSAPVDANQIPAGVYTETGSATTSTSASDDQAGGGSVSLDSTVSIDGDASQQAVSASYLKDLENSPNDVLAALEELLSSRRAGPVELRVAERGNKRRLLQLAERNAKLAVDQQRLRSEHRRHLRAVSLEELQEGLGLQSLPVRIECFDISNLGGTHTTASMVVFEGGLAKKSDYRRFTIRTVEGSDDFASMNEVLSRRYAQWEQQSELSPYDAKRDPSFASQPNLIVIDGGKGQLSAGIAALQGFRDNGVAVVSLAKRIEEVFIPDRAQSVQLSHDTAGLQLLQRVRDEAHRFALGHHKIRRDKAMVESVIDDLPGVGPARKRALLKHFGAPDAVLSATREQLESVPGIPPKVARQIYAYINRTGR